MSKSWRAIVLILVTANSLVCGAPTVSPASNDRRNIAEINAAEHVTPGAQNVLTLDNDTVSYALREGDTTLIISLVQTSPRDRFTFINENAAARGELRIAVSKEKLSAESDKWTPVDGAVSFKRKRLFNVSMLGVEAKYVRLTFHVEHDNSMAAAGWQGMRTVSR